MLESRSAKVNRAIDWFEKLSDPQKSEVARQLFDYAVEQQYLGVWKPEDVEELAEENKRPVEYYEAPYIRSCGEPLVEFEIGVRPITPAEATEKKYIPEEVFAAFNELIEQKLHNGHATILQKEAISKICSKMKTSGQEICDNHWLDVEEHYRKAGWNVKYDKPGFNETGNAYFEFKKK